MAALEPLRSGCREWESGGGASDEMGLESFTQHLLGTQRPGPSHPLPSFVILIETSHYDAWGGPLGW